MASETSNPAPPQKSSWPWSGRKRRGSESSLSSLSSLRDFVTGRRNSLSVTDLTEANVLRKKPPNSSAPKSRAPEGKEANGTAAAAADSDDAKKNRRSQSR
jgi:hypothetical protein